MAVGRPKECKVCKSKDNEIRYLREMLRDMTIPKGNGYMPTYINEKGQIDSLSNPESEEMQEVDVANEILGH